MLPWQSGDIKITHKLAYFIVIKIHKCIKVKFAVFDNNAVTLLLNDFGLILHIISGLTDT